MTFIPQFGGSIRKKDLEKFKKSAHWDGKKFNNLTPTLMGFNFRDLPEVLRDNFSDKQKRTPAKKLPIQAFDPKKFQAADQTPKFIWYGHSVLLLQFNGKNLLIDPMFGENASPIAPFKTKRFSRNTLQLIDQLPPIDAVLLTHDHYDHLDYSSILKLIPKVNTWIVALGVSRHLEKWGLEAEKITEMNWWDEISFEGIKITFTPSRHFSGRGAFDRAKSLWGGYIFQSPDHKIYHSGDGGYGEHFKQVGEKYGPFDLMFVECGQYYKHWAEIHLFPEESVQAAKDALAKVAVPVHWGAFTLSPHQWKDPVERFCKSAEKQAQDIFTPELGAINYLDELQFSNRWWEELE
ncbi:MBL fold metallo-hydrolase [Echinicola sediminis]